MAITVGNIILDGVFTDFTAADRIDRPANMVSGYAMFGKLVADPVLGDTYVIGFQATSTSDPVIGANTTIWLNTDQNKATGFSPFGSVGAEYYVNWVDIGGVATPYLYNPADANSAFLLNYGVSAADGGKSFEIAIPRSLITSAGASAPKSIDLVADINNSIFLPGDYTNPQYTITDPSTVTPVEHAVKKVGIVWSETSANQYFSKTAYADLFMAAQHQAEAAGVSYDILTEADLTNVSKLAQYGALVFPSMSNVNSADLPAIASALNQVVYNYHVGLITAGDFMTNDQTGAALTGDSYAQMKSLLNLTLASTGTDTYTVTPDNLANPIMKGYTAGQLIGGSDGQLPGTTPGVYTGAGYSTYTGVSKPADELADINLSSGQKVAGVVQTTTGGTNVHFATTGLLGDSNLLQHAIQNVVYGSTTPSVALDMTRMAGVLASRTDMDQSQFPSEVSPTDANGNPAPGIYDKLLPILQNWKQQYNFVGSYFVNVGDGNAPNADSGTNWVNSLPYYQQLLAMGNEIGNHSYTHLITPPAGAPATWAENTNFLNTGTGPWTFDYEFNQSKQIEQQNIGSAIAGVAVPGMPESITTAENILPYYQSIPGLTGYITGGWTGVGSGYPNAFGYLTPNDAGSVYLAPNMTFDFTEIEFQHKTPEQALADWKAQLDKLSTNSDVPVVLWPWHDYGAADWDTTGTGVDSPYTTQMYTDFIAYAAGKQFEFVTEGDLAARIAAQQKASISTTTAGNIITATVTPDASSPGLGNMALDLVNGSSQVIQNVANWYAYDSDSVFLPQNGGSFAVTLGAAQDDVTHIASLPMRADLLSVTGDGTNLSFSILGDGVVVVDLKDPGTQAVAVQGAQTASLSGDKLTLTFSDPVLSVSPSQATGVPVQHNVTITEGAAPGASAGDTLILTSGATVTASGSGAGATAGTGTGAGTGAGTATGAGTGTGTGSPASVVDVAGDNVWTGSAPGAHFVFNPINPVTNNAGFGNDVITNFVVSGDSHSVIELSLSMFDSDTTAASLLNDWSEQDGVNTVIWVDDNNSITLNNISLATLKQNLADIHLA